MRSASSKKQGFTLIEVLIAVAVLAIALLAVLRAIEVSIGNSQHLQQKTIAHWIAMNTLASARSGIILLPTAGATQRGDNKMLGSDYHWEMTANNLPDLPIMKIQIRVFDSSKKVSLDTVQTFVEKPGTNYAAT